MIRLIILCGWSALCLVAIADKLHLGSEDLAAIARVAGINEDLVVDKARRVELVESLGQRIAQGYREEKTIKIRGKTGEIPEEEWNEVWKHYMATQAKGFDRALFLATYFQCVELVPMLVEMGDMKVLWDDQLQPPSTRTIAGMGAGAIEPLFDIIENCPRANDRYWALIALGMGEWSWRDVLKDESLAERMEKHCDTDKRQVQLALAYLRGDIGSAKDAVVWEEAHEAKQERSAKSAEADELGSENHRPVDSRRANADRGRERWAAGNAWGIGIGVALLLFALIWWQRVARRRT